MCEQLVRDNIFDRIEVTRLPVGHTHEDIDALFAVLWRCAQDKTILIPEEWKHMSLSAFKNGTFDVNSNDENDDPEELIPDISSEVLRATELLNVETGISESHDESCFDDEEFSDDELE